jgi:lipoprotein Spr
VLFAFTRPAVAGYAATGSVAADTAVLPVGDPEFLDDITIGDDDEDAQDGGKKKGGKSAKTTKKTTTVASPAKKLAALTPEEENMIRDLPRKHQKAIGIELSAPLNFKYAILLDVPVEMINDSKLLETIESWYGTKYKFGGDDRNGIDCSGFTQAFMLSYYDLKIPRSSQDQYKQSSHIKKKKLRQGDLVFFKTKGAKKGITHVGVYLCNNKFVHAATSSGVMISDLDEEYYAKRFVGGGRIK